MNMFIIFSILLGSGTNIGPYWSPHPHPWHQQKSPARGNTIKQNIFLIIFYDNYEKITKYRWNIKNQ